MAVVNGNSIIVFTDDTVLGSQRGVSFDSSADMLDVSDKTSDNAQFLPGKRTETVTCSAFYVRDDTAQAALRASYDAGSTVEIDWIYGSDDGTTGTGERTAMTAYVSSLSVSAPEHGPAETEVTFQISGGWGTYSV